MGSDPEVSHARVTAVIPARYGSTRFPGKPLAEIAGKPMVVQVCERAKASGATSVCVATDDERIREAVERAGHRALMTRADHPSGTDRIAEAAGVARSSIPASVGVRPPLRWLQA